MAFSLRLIVKTSQTSTPWTLLAVKLAEDAESIAVVRYVFLSSASHLLTGL